MKKPIFQIGILSGATYTLIQILKLGIHLKTFTWNSSRNLGSV